MTRTVIECIVIVALIALAILGGAFLIASAP